MNSHLSDLPLELQLKIFESLEIFDLLNLRLVCKHFRMITSHVLIKELVFDLKNSKNNLYYHTKLKKRNIIYVGQYSTLNLLKSTHFNLVNLKRLCINSINGEQLSIDFLNKFDKLIHLEIIDCAKCDGELNNLKNLEILNFNTIHNCNLIIDTPKLKILSCKVGIKQIELKHPETISHLDMYVFEEKIFSFINLEYLKLDHFYQVGYQNFISSKIIEKFPKLKGISFSMQDYDEKNFSYTMETLLYLLNEKKRLNRLVKLHFKNHLIIDNDQIENLSPNDFFDDLNSLESENSSDYIYYDDDDLDLKSDDSFIDGIYD